jgi:hypothetical protein
MDAVHLITGLAEPATQGRALLVDVRGMTVAREEVVRAPDCEVCSAPAGTASRRGATPRRPPG